MLVKCEKCGTEFSHSNKKFAKRRGKTHKIVSCPECGNKNLVPIYMRRVEPDQPL
jgi:DNA-directed RNA polymerase subunit RPC12/RpoP